MATSNRPRRRSQLPPNVTVRVREDLDGDAVAVSRPRRRDRDYDLLTAGIIGLTVGAIGVFLLRRNSHRDRPHLKPFLRGLGQGAFWAGKKAAHFGGAGARWAADRGGALWDRVPRDEIRDHFSDYMGRAREAIDDVVESELKDLRKYVREQRKHLCD